MNNIQIDLLIAEYNAAYRLRNKAQPPHVSYAKGWFTIRYASSALGTKHRRSEVERFRDRLEGRALPRLVWGTNAMTNPADELQQLADEVAALGAQIETRRLRVLELLNGKTLTTRSNNSFVVDRVRVEQGGMRSFRFWVEGPRLKADGAPHARTRDSLII